MFKGFINTKAIYKNNKMAIELTVLVETSFCSGTENGLYLKLSNGEILLYDNVSIACRHHTNQRKYVLKGTILLSHSLEEKLSKHYITQFGLGGRIINTNEIQTI